MSHFALARPSVKKLKEKKKKRNINTDLAILPSHDIDHGCFQDISDLICSTIVVTS